MMERDADGFIISALQEGAKPYKNLSCMVIPEADGLPEFTPDAHNHVNSFFRKVLRAPFEIDNLNNREWHEITAELERAEVANVCKVAYEKGAERLAAVVMQAMREQISSPAEPAEYTSNLAHETVLDICIAADSGKIHIELPHCTVKTLCEFGLSL